MGKDFFLTADNIIGSACDAKIIFSFCSGYLLYQKIFIMISSKLIFMVRFIIRKQVWTTFLTTLLSKENIFLFAMKYFFPTFVFML